MRGASSAGTSERLAWEAGPSVVHAARPSGGGGGMSPSVLVMRPARGAPRCSAARSTSVTLGHTSIRTAPAPRAPPRRQNHRAHRAPRTREGARSTQSRSDIGSSRAPHQRSGQSQN